MSASKSKSAGCSPTASQNRIPLETSSVEKTWAGLVGRQARTVRYCSGVATLIAR